MEKKELFTLAVKVVPKSHKNEIVGWEGNTLKIRLRAVPEKGLANAELLRFLASVLDVSPSRLALIQGSSSRHKRISISGISQEEALKRFSAF